MAREIIDDQAGQSGSHEGQLTVIKVNGQADIALPETNALSQGDILRDGQDLILQGSDGREIVIEDYFSALTPPTLSTTHGSLLTPELVQSFIKADTLQYAAQDTASDTSPVGSVREVSGEATVTRADGSNEKIVLGTEIHQGDIVETTAGGAVNIVFADESSFAISSNARMTIDEYVFDPAAQSGETNVSILRGIFVFTSGLIGRDDPDDVQIDTPVGSIGIRGTTIAGTINPDGESQITVIEGAIVIRNGSGEVTLDQQYETVTLTGHDNEILENGQIDTRTVKDDYSSLENVVPTFFNTLNETESPVEGTIPEAAPEGEPATEGAVEGTIDTPTEETAPAETVPTETVPLEGAGADEGAMIESGDDPQAPAEDPALQDVAPEEKVVLADYDIHSDPLQTNFDQSVTLEPYNPYQQPLLNTDILSGNSIMLSPNILPPPPPPPGATDLKTATTTSNTVEPAPLPPLELVVKMRVDDDAVAGSVVGTAYTTLPYPGAVMQFISVPLSSSSTPMFTLLQEGPGVYKIILTADGAADILSMSLGTLIGSVVIGVRLADGRMDSGSDNAIYNDFENIAGSPLPPPTLPLDTMGAANGSSHSGFAGKGYGFASAFL
ncbi:MAG: FecR domain-containing protein, partial [Alphaproteobacteria bacterium]|nr:FecR domain-containing protein [Alphaproteobacteria bacterium]